MLMYYAFTPDSVFQSVPSNGSEPTGQTSMLYTDIVPLIYVNETICMVVCPSFKIQVNHFMAQDKPFGAILNFKTFLSFIKQTASDYVTSS